MKTVFWAFLLSLLLLLPPLVNAQQSNYTIELGQSTWNKATLKVLVFVNETEVWWQSFFPNMTINAVQQWNDAFRYFADNYPAYNYLANLQLTTTVSNTTLPGYDIYVVFDPNVLISGVDALGETLVESYINRTIKLATVTLSAKSQVVDLTAQVYRDTTAHELGHALGLGHCNRTDDLMYPYQDIIASGYAISTLDLFGVALLFGWMQGETVQALPGAAALPSKIEYTYAPVNNPAPTSIADNPVVRFLVVIFLDPIILALAIVMIIVLIILGITLRQRAKWRREQRKADWVKNRQIEGSGF